MNAHQVLLDLVVEIGERRVAEYADSDGVLVGEWAVRSQTEVTYRQMAALADADPDRALLLLDGLVGRCFGVLIGQQPDADRQVVDPLRSIELSASMSAAQRLLSDLLPAYAQVERSIPGRVLADALLVSEEHAERVRTQIDADVAEHG